MAEKDNQQEQKKERKPGVPPTEEEELARQIADAEAEGMCPQKKTAS